ncbi:MAG: hypothetical protein R6V10_01130 [bacterium]
MAVVKTMDTWRSEELIRDFYRSLHKAGVSNHTASRHRDKLRFFLHAYLMEEWPRELDRVDGEVIRDFLGSWFLRHVGGSKSDVIGYLGTFRRFFDHLYQTGRLSQPELEDLLAVCTSKEFFLACFDEYFNPFPDAWEDFSQGRPSLRHVDPPGHSVHHPVDRQLWMLVRNLERPQPPAILDFALFLDYLSYNTVGLTRAHSHIPVRHIRRMNQRFTRPEELPSRTRMEASSRVKWFYHLGLTLHLCRVGKKNVMEVTPLAEAFLDLDADTQLAIILDATWNHLNWSDLGMAETRKVSEWAQEHKEGFAALLSDLTPHRHVPLDSDPGVEREEALMARYIYFHDVVENVLLYALRECGVLEYTRRSEGDAQMLQIKSLAMSRFGRQVMRLYARRDAGRGSTAENTLIKLQENLLFS